MSGITIHPVFNQPADPTKAAAFFPFSQAAQEWVSVKDRLEPGIRIAFFAIVEIEADGSIQFRTSAHSCWTDLFKPVGLEPAMFDELAVFAGMTVVVIATVRQRLEDFSCHGGLYEIEPAIEISCLPLNPRIGQEWLPPGTKVMVEGTFLRYYESTPVTTLHHSHHTTVGHVVILADGQELDLACFPNTGHHPVYASGVLENIRNKPVHEGEKLRVVATVTQHQTLEIGHNRPHLLEAYAERLARYNSLRQLLEAMIGELEILIGNNLARRARKMFSDLRFQELTSAERQRVAELIQRLPVEERPIFYGDDPSTALELHQAFGVNVEEFNRAQFLSFAHDVVSGKCPNFAGRRRRVDISQLFLYLLDEPFGRQDLTGLVVACMDARLQLLEAASDDPDNYWDHLSLLQRCIELCTHQTPELAAKLVEIISFCLDRSLVKKEWDVQACPARFTSLVPQCFLALANIKRAGHDIPVTAKLLAEWRIWILDYNASYSVTDAIQTLADLY